MAGDGPWIKIEPPLADLTGQGSSCSGRVRRCRLTSMGIPRGNAVDREGRPIEGMAFGDYHHPYCSRKLAIMYDTRISCFRT